MVDRAKYDIELQSMRGLNDLFARKTAKEVEDEAKAKKEAQTKLDVLSREQEQLKTQLESI